MLFNLNKTTIKRLLELKMSLVKSWDLITLYTDNAGIIGDYTMSFKVYRVSRDSLLLTVHILVRINL